MEIVHTLCEFNTEKLVKLIKEANPNKELPSSVSCICIGDDKNIYSVPPMVGEKLLDMRLKNIEVHGSLHDLCLTEPDAKKSTISFPNIELRVRINSVGLSDSLVLQTASNLSNVIYININLTNIDEYGLGSIIYKYVNPIVEVIDSLDSRITVSMCNKAK